MRTSAIRVGTALLLAGAMAATAAASSAASGGGAGYEQSFGAVMAPDASVATATCDDQLPAGWQRSEEGRSGTRAWNDGRSTGRISGYLGSTSAMCGDTVDVHLSGRGRAVVSAYRLGWYGGKGGRLVWTSAPVRTTPGATPRPTALGMIELSWPVAAQVSITPDWLPGLYILVARPAGQPAAPGAAMPLVVRQTGRSKLLAVASTLTWQAYNHWGGRSTYVGPPDHIYSRAREVSFDRPYAEAGLNHIFVYDAPLARFLGRIRAEVSWTTDDSIDREPSQLLQHDAIAFGGHSEYWSDRMFDAVENARNTGVNIAFLGANPVFWQVRLGPDATSDRRRMTVYKHLDEDPVARSEPRLATVKWRDSPVDRDEAQLVGQTYDAGSVHGGYQVTDAPDWMLAGTGLARGDGLASAASNEVDTLTGVSAGDRAPNVQTVMAGTWADSGGHVGQFDATFYTTPSGSGVFSAGTTAWDCDLDRSCPADFGNPSPATAQAMRTMTANILTGFTTPGFTAAHPSRATAPISTPAFRAHMSRALRGFRGRRTRGGLNDD